jgi:hypothetical protein
MTDGGVLESVTEQAGESAGAGKSQLPPAPAP